MSLMSHILPKQNINMLQLNTGIAKTSTASQMIFNKNINLQSHLYMTNFNGIIFRERQLLIQLGIFQLMIKKQKQKIGNYLKSNCLTININLFFEDKDQQMIRLTLSQYKLQVVLKVKFAYINKKYVYSGYNFVKIGLIADGLSRNIKILLNQKAFAHFLQTLRFKNIKYHVNFDESISQFSLCSTVLQILQTIQSNESCQQFKHQKVDYFSGCTFNGKPNCLAIFTSSNILVIKGKRVIKILNKNQFLSRQNWIESETDWISFQSPDHQLVFKQKLVEVAIKAEEKQRIKRQQIQYKKNDTIQKQLNYKDDLLSTIVMSQIKQYDKINVNIFLSQKIQKQQIIINNKNFNQKLFYQQKMVDEEQQDQKSIQNQENQQLLYKTNEGSRCMRNERDEIEQKQFNMQDYQIIQDNIMIQQNNQINQKSLLIEEQSLIISQNYILQQEQQIKKQYRSNLKNSMSYCSINNGFDSTKFQTQEATRRTLRQCQSPNQFNLKQNCKNLLNRGSNSNMKSLTFIDDAGFVQKQSYVYKRQESFLNLASFHEESQSHNSFDINQAESEIIEDQSSYLSKNNQTPEFACIWQLNSRFLGCLTANKMVLLHERIGNQFLQHCEFNLKSSEIQNIFKAYDQRKFIFTENRKRSLKLFDLNLRQSTQICQAQSDIMDIKNVNENEIIILQDNTINVLDHRDSHISKGLCFKKSQLFEKIDMIGNMVVTGRSDGIVKIYDLRYNKPKSLNNFKLNGEMYANNKFKKLTVLNSLDIFCHYGCTSFIINGQNQGDKNIYTNNIRLSKRSYIEQYSVPSKITDSIDKFQKYPGQIQFSIQKNGSNIISLYKNYEFIFERKNKKIKQWNRFSVNRQERCFYLQYNQQNNDGELIYGIKDNKGYSFKIK